MGINPDPSDFRAIFVGGPLDGETMEVPPDKAEWLYEVPQDIESEMDNFWGFNDARAATPTKLKIAIYRRVHLRGGEAWTGRRRPEYHHVFVYDGDEQEFERAHRTRNRVTDGPQYGPRFGPTKSHPGWDGPF